MDSQDSTLRLIAFVFCVISTVTAGWMLIFVSLVGGILLLVSKKDA